MLLRSKGRRERALRQAEHLVNLGREGGESLLQAVPVAREHVEELRDQAHVLLHRIDDMREQARPAIDEARKSVQDGRASAAHAAAAAALAAEISPKRSRSKIPLVIAVLLALGGTAAFWWKRRNTQGEGWAYRPEPLTADSPPL